MKTIKLYITEENDGVYRVNVEMNGYPPQENYFEKVELQVKSSSGDLTMELE
jgi:hypothetical protein